MSNKQHFTYQNHNFVPAGCLPQEEDFFQTTRKCRSLGIGNYDGGDWSHTEFYKAARTVGAEAEDLFLMDGEILVLPCENELFQYRPDHTRKG